MATSQTYNGDGSTTAFAFTIPYINTTDVKAQIGGVATTAFSVSGSTVTFNSAPASGTNNIKIFRETNNTTIEANFQSGSALRAVDFNDNFTQVLYVTQEATETANDAIDDSAAAVTSSNNAVSTANTASTNATNAVNTANTASTNATNAVNTANTASTNATNAVNTANTASTNASSAVTTANSATTTANSAVTTANSAVTTANSASTTATTASTNASSAVTTANSAEATANAASAAVAAAVLYDPVANVAAIPGSPSNGDYIELNDSTGIESFSPLSDMPAGFVGDSGLVVRLKYITSPSTTWQWQNYFAKDSETRYLKDNAAQIIDADINASAAISLSKLATGALPSGITVASANITDGTIVDADINGSAAISLSKLATGALPSGITIASANITDGTIVDADINASAAIAGTKISPDFGSQNILTTGSLGIGTTTPSSYNASADNLVVQNDGGTGAAGITIRAGTGSQSTVYFADGTGASDAIRGYVQYFHNGDFLRFGTDANERMRIDSSGNTHFGGGTDTTSTNAAYISVNGTYVSNRTAGTNDLWNGKVNGTVTSTINADGSVVVDGSVTAQGTTLTSDQRFKENITDAKSQLADVTALGNKLRNWDWTADAPVVAKNTRFLGLVAQEVETICPGIVTTIPRTKKGAELTPETTDEEGVVTPATYEELDDSYKGIKNDILIMKLLGAVAELSAKVAALESA